MVTWIRSNGTMCAVLALLPALIAAPAEAQFARCRADQVKAGTVCIDKYEASVWSVPGATTFNRPLVRKLQLGRATAADLTAGGATQVGVASDDYPCSDHGDNCTNVIFAASIAGVVPSAYATWLQAQQACANSLKRLPANGEWQIAAMGTPDPGPDNGISDCNSGSAFAAVASGSRSACVSSRGAFDMVGNLYEWTADWVPASDAFGCPYWGAAANDDMCLLGANPMPAAPGVITRGGYYGHGSDAGPLAVDAFSQAHDGYDFLGFRCAR
jgi:hypothetical protein